MESALIVPCPAADPALGHHRARLDRAAEVGVPAHVTVLYPFRPEPAVDDDERLRALLAAVPAWTTCFDRTAWFDDAVLYLAPADPAPFVELTAVVAAAFPEHPPYGGAFATVVPHLTVGSSERDVDALRAAERAVLPRLPIEQAVDHVELWCGPALATAPAASWRRRASYRLG